jgi:hypothetical protein
MAIDQHREVHLPRSGALGPDPEPLGQRFDELMWRERAGRLAAPPAECPLQLALGNRCRCAGETCVFYRVPGVDSACAPLGWSPSVAHDPRLARWYIARRDEAAAAREHLLAQN